MNKKGAADLSLAIIVLVVIGGAIAYSEYQKTNFSDTGTLISSDVCGDNVCGMYELNSCALDCFNSTGGNSTHAIDNSTPIGGDDITNDSVTLLPHAIFLGISSNATNYLSDTFSSSISSWGTVSTYPYASWNQDGSLRLSVNHEYAGASSEVWRSFYPNGNVLVAHPGDKIIFEADVKASPQNIEKYAGMLGIDLRAEGSQTVVFTAAGPGTVSTDWKKLRLEFVIPGTGFTYKPLETWYSSDGLSKVDNDGARWGVWGTTSIQNYVGKPMPSNMTLTAWLALYNYPSNDLQSSFFSDFDNVKLYVVPANIISSPYPSEFTPPVGIPNLIRDGTFDVGTNLDTSWVWHSGVPVGAYTITSLGKARIDGYKHTTNDWNHIWQGVSNNIRPGDTLIGRCEIQTGGKGTTWYHNGAGFGFDFRPQVEASAGNYEQIAELQAPNTQLTQNIKIAAKFTVPYTAYEDDSKWQKSWWFSEGTPSVGSNGKIDYFMGGVNDRPTGLKYTGKAMPSPLRLTFWVHIWGYDTTPWAEVDNCELYVIPAGYVAG